MIETTVHLIEAPPVEIREEVIEKRVETIPVDEAPRSVREWDGLSLRSPSPKSHRSHSRRRSRSRRGSSPEKIIDVHRDSITVREVSPARTAKSGKSRRDRDHSPSFERTEIIERRVVEEDDLEESNSIHVGPLALVVDHDRRKSKSDRELKAEIKALEDERRSLKRERRDREVVKVEKREIIRERSPARGEREEEEFVEVKKDRKGRMMLIR